MKPEQKSPQRNSSKGGLSVLNILRPTCLSAQMVGEAAYSASWQWHLGVLVLFRPTTPDKFASFEGRIKW